jgi:hypothetical protein
LTPPQKTFPEICKQQTEKPIFAPMKEKNLAAQLAAQLGVSPTRATIILKFPERGASKQRILSVIDRLEIAAKTRAELRERLENIKEQPRKKGEKGRKLYALIEGKEVEICAASKIRRPSAIFDREKANELRYAGIGELPQPLPYERSHFEVGKTYHFWSINKKQK